LKLLKCRCFVEECGGTLTESSGSIQSVLYPDRYHDNANCTWVITVPDQKLIKLRCALTIDRESGFYELKKITIHEFY